MRDRIPFLMVGLTVCCLGNSLPSLAKEPGIQPDKKPANVAAQIQRWQIEARNTFLAPMPFVILYAIEVEGSYRLPWLDDKIRANLLLQCPPYQSGTLWSVDATPMLRVRKIIMH